MTFESEFAVVDVVTQSQFPTHSVDAFALSVIKMERQMRKLFTYLIYQSEAFGPQDIEPLKAVLGANHRAYFEGFERGINTLYRTSVEDMVGAEYVELRPVLDDAIDVRNKVFHGQLTARCLQQEDLGALSVAIRRWCFRLARGADAEIGYDGFGRNSFRKGPVEILDGFLAQVRTPEEYRTFIRRHVARP
ncbi:MULTISPECIES: hypothetical protein [Paraburkholderia]|uniref:hypothetical protein n=1 Tax=Paraburkholderia TaxID=1822464 RepID=UPI0038B94122